MTRAASDVRLGVQTCSFRSLRRTARVDSVETVIEALRACDVRECELFAPQVEARFGAAHTGHHSMSSMSPQMMRRELRKWRLRTPMSYFQAIGNRFQKAGIAIDAYSYSPDRSFTDQEIDSGFSMAKALGAAIITAATTLDVAKRIAPFAERQRMVVALQSNVGTADANEIGTPQSFAAATAMSRYFKVSLDIGHFTAANFDPVGYIRDHHESITNLHLKDRRRNEGDSLPWGQGDTPIREVLQAIKREAWPIRAYVDYDYASQNSPIDEVKKCLAYAAHALL